MSDVGSSVRTGAPAQRLPDLVMEAPRIGARKTARSDLDKPPRHVPSPKFASTLAYGLELLTALRSEGDGVSNAELADRLGVSRPTISRLCATLLQLGYILKDRRGLYRPAARTLVWAADAVSFNLRKVAWAPMRDEALHNPVTLSLVVLSGTHAINFLAVRIHDDAPELPQLGKAAPLERSAAGCAALAMQGSTAREALQRAIIRERRDSWNTHGTAVAASVAECRSRGFCVSLGRLDPALYAAASPVGVTSEGNLLSVSINLAASATTPRAMENKWGPQVRSLAQSIRSLDPSVELEFSRDE